MGCRWGKRFGLKNCNPDRGNYPIRTDPNLLCQVCVRFPISIPGKGWPLPCLGGHNLRHNLRHNE